MESWLLAATFWLERRRARAGECCLCVQALRLLVFCGSFLGSWLFRARLLHIYPSLSFFMNPTLLHHASFIFCTCLLHGHNDILACLTSRHVIFTTFFLTPYPVMMVTAVWLHKHPSPLQYAQTILTRHRLFPCVLLDRQVFQGVLFRISTGCWAFISVGVPFTFFALTRGLALIYLIHGGSGDALGSCIFRTGDTSPHSSHYV
ncbi:hypothetical protein EV421DRAFT_1857348 [Armillaria borealis]|uniref:Uncharacterized protein n=1 Tax=Armillaria borealis TaxID=47425 RepID=A0AA39MEA8_9AGAR|nr:hypothetical protein EV421DRAFT_1857348 [Armillaria borealis]